MSLSDPATKCGLYSLADVSGKVRFMVEGILMAVQTTESSPVLEVLGGSGSFATASDEFQARTRFAMGSICQIRSLLRARARLALKQDRQGYTKLFWQPKYQDWLTTI